MGHLKSRTSVSSGRHRRRLHRSPRSGTTWPEASAVSLPPISADRRAFSPTSHITHCDGGIGMRTRQAAASSAPERPRPHRTAHRDVPGPGPRWMIPGWSPSPAPDRPGSPCTRPASRPSGNPSLRPGGIRAPRPAFSLIPCAVTRDQLRRKGDRLRAAGTTHGDASITAIRKPCGRQKRTGADGISTDGVQLS
jgi:hypothetical protein